MLQQHPQSSSLSLFHFSDTQFAFLWIKPLKMGIDLESLSEATSGAIGALVSTTILYPLDTCKTKYQAEVRTQHQQKYRLNLFPSLLTSAPHISIFVYFIVYNLSKFRFFLINWLDLELCSLISAYIRKMGYCKLGLIANFSEEFKS